MAAMDYCRLIEEADIVGLEPVSGLYDRGDGVQFRSEGRERELVSDVIRLTDNALLLAGDFRPVGDMTQHQVVTGKEWIHLQFRYSASGSERIDQADVIDLPQRACIMARYAEGTEVFRELSGSERLTHVCLFATQQGLAELLDVSVDQIERNVLRAMIADDREQATRAIPLRSPMIAAGHDVISCSLRGISRRAYMRAKSIELLSSVLSTLGDATSDAPGVVIEASTRDIQRIEAAQELMALNLQSRLMLAELARRVGMSRTKLAITFKAVTGVTVQDYWRNLRLLHAYKALTTTEMSVTEAAYEAGYSELSSFTKAFHAKFGSLPRDCKADPAEVRRRH